MNDSATDRILIKNTLSDYNVLTAEDGLDALRVIESEPDINIIILDLNMPKMDGFWVLKTLGTDEKYSELRVIILTTSDEINNEIKGLKLGVVDYVRKPVQSDLLRMRIEVHIELQRMQRLIENKQYYRDLTLNAILSQSTMGIAISHNIGPSEAGINEILAINPTFEQITGRSREELVRLGWGSITHPDDLELDLVNYRRMLTGEIKSYSMEKRYIRPDGSVVWVNIDVAPLDYQDGKSENHICLVQDITERKAMEKELLDSERSKAIFLDNLPGVAYRCSYDRDWTMQYISAGCRELTGYGAEAFTNNNQLAFNDIIIPEYREVLWKKWKSAVANHTKVVDEYEIVTASGEKKWIWEQGQAVYDEAGNVTALEGLLLDITDRKTIERKLKYLSERDQLTGALNSHAFEELCNNNLNCGRLKKSAVIAVIIRKFNTLCSTLGYHFCEELVMNIANCLRDTVRDDRSLFHISIDRFVLYITDYDDSNDLKALCAEISVTLEREIRYKTVGINLGIIEIEPNSALDAENLLICAAFAAGNVSEPEPVGYRFFNKTMEEKLKRENDIRRAIAETSYNDNDAFLTVDYQPIYNLRTHRTEGFEALARYKNADLGTIPPNEFIPIAEASQLMIPFGRKIMRQVFAFAAKLQSKGFGDIMVSFNVSAIQLLNNAFIPEINALVKEYGIDARVLNIEITESVFADNYHEINKKLGKIRGLGIHISIDDFGTGYSSLSRVRELSIDCLKIDKYFLDKLMTIDKDKAITGDIISMAHKLGYCVVAEGVEYEEQLRYLIKHKCDMIQGYLISRPIDESAALRLLKSTCAASCYQSADYCGEPDRNCPLLS